MSSAASSAASSAVPEPDNPSEPGRPSEPDRSSEPDRLARTRPAPGPLPPPDLPPDQPPDLPPERLDLTGLILRRWTMDDVPFLFAAVVESFDHLHPWMPWAAERPEGPGAQREYIDSMTRMWDSGEKYAYAVFDASGRTLLGSAVLHDRVGPHGMEIGYWVHARHAGRGVAGTCASALTAVVLGLRGRRRVEIHCDRANTASVAIPRRLGYRLDRTVAAEILAPGETGELMVWTMTADAFPGSEAERRARAVTPSPARS